MTTPKQPEYAIGERVYIAGMHRNYKPVIVAIEHGKVTVKTEGVPGSERVFKVNELQKISR